ncbi:OadG family transporter subunit [Chloroflexota bacterium]
MVIDWEQARLIGGMGFGVVFALLAFLSLLIWLTGFVISKIDSGRAEVNDKKKGA